MITNFIGISYYTLLIILYLGTGYYVFERGESYALFLLTILITWVIRPMKIDIIHMYIANGQMENTENQEGKSS